MNIRPVQGNDYETLAAIWNLVYPEDLYTATEFKYLDTTFEDPCKFARYVAELHGKVVASANYEQHQGMYHPQKFYVRVWVHPEYEKREIGAKLYAHLLKELKPHNPIQLRAQVREHLGHAVNFAEERGFEETKRDWESVLDMNQYTPETFEKLEQKAQSNGITIKALADFADMEGVARTFFEIFNELRQDVPRSEPATPLTWTYFKKSMLDAPDFYPGGTFLAFKGANAIGLTQFWKGESSDDLYTGLTAVKKQVRGQGVASALKARALRFAKETGATRVFTDNDTNNIEMIAINDKLGFKKLPAWLSMKKEMT